MKVASAVTGEQEDVTIDPAEHPLIAAARAWYDAGFAVIPCHEDGSKRPFGPWRAYQLVRPDWTMVREWLESGRFTGIGLLMGAASGNTEMIELEGPLQAALQRLERVIERAREQDFAALDMPNLLARIARGCSAQSAGNGLHLYIRVIDGPSKGNTKLAFEGQGPDRKVVAETRGEGGFVVAPPTPARNGHQPGSAYLFLQGSTPAGKVVVTSEERDLIHLLINLALHEADTPSPITIPGKVLASSSEPGAFDAYRQAVTWRDILGPVGWREGFTDADGRTHWTRPGGDHFEGTSATTLEDGPLYVFSTNAGLPTEQGLSKGTVYALLNHGGDLSAAGKALVEEGYGQASTILPPWEASLDPDATADEREEAKTSYIRERLPILDWQALWADTTEEEWIVEPLLAKRRLVALYSAPKVGKSLLMLELAAAMACGRPVLGNNATEPLAVLYVDFENDPRGDIRTRLEAMGYAPSDLANLCYLSFPTLAKLDTKQGADELLAAIEEYGCQVVVIDTVSRSVAGDENENDTWLNFYRHTGLRLKQAEVAMIRLDHSGKDESKGQRGGSAKSGDVDAVWRLSRLGEDTFRLSCEAHRFPISEQLVDLQRVEDPHLRHKRDMDARAKATDEIIAKLAKAGVPRDGSVSARQAKKIMRNANVTFGNGAVTTAAMAEYCRRLPVFETPEIGTE
jgi:hypothetical protein